MKAGNPWVLCAFGNVFSWCLFCFCFPQKGLALVFCCPWSGWLHARALVESDKKICKIQNLFSQWWENAMRSACRAVCICIGMHAGICACGYLYLLGGCHWNLHTPFAADWEMLPHTTAGSNDILPLMLMLELMLRFSSIFSSIYMKL